MKATALLSLLVLITPLAAQNETATADKKPDASKQSLLPNQAAFLNLPEESRKDSSRSRPAIDSQSVQAPARAGLIHH